MFGLLVDYYVPDPAFRPDAVPSDCVYVFEYDRVECRFTAVNAAQIDTYRERHADDQRMYALVESLATIFRDHSRLRSEPRA